MTKPRALAQPAGKPYLQVLLQDMMPAQAFLDTAANIFCINQETFWELP